MKRTKLQIAIGAFAPYIAIRTIWTYDRDLHDIRKDCDGMDDENPEDWQAWQSEIRAMAVCDGEEITASAYLGGTWEKAGDIPEESNPEISGYEQQMTVEALEELQKLIPEAETVLHEQISKALQHLQTLPLD